MDSRLLPRGRSRANLVRLAGVVAVALGGVVLAYALSSLQASAQRSSDAARQAVDLIADLRTIDGQEWRVAAGESPQVAVGEIDDALESATTKLEHNRFFDDHTELVQLTNVYGQAVKDMVAASLAGARAEAARIDSTRVDPTFERLIALAVTIDQQQRAKAARAAETSRQLTWAVAISAALLLGALLWGVFVHRERQRRSAVDRRFRSLVECSSDVITVICDDAVEVLSPFTGRLAPLGLDGSSLTRGLLAARVGDVWLAADDLLTATCHRQRVELKVESSSGPALWLDAEGTVLDGSNGERVWVWRDVTARKVLEHELTRQAFHDSLTGTANRSLLHERVSHALTLSARKATPVTVLFCDLDDFKAVNDSLGHTYGDRLLTTVSSRIASCIRDSDTLARLGGDEFAVLLEDASVDDATTLADRLLSVVGLPVDLDGNPVFPSMSVGIATAVVGASTDELLRNADLAMYAAKRQGKGRAAVYHEAMHQVSEELRELQADLKRAIAGDELCLHFQPTIDLGSGAVVGLEALVRWNHPTRGLLSPDCFVPLAESTGQIVAIGRWVLAEACRAGRELNNASASPMLMHINLAPQQLRDPSIVSAVRLALETTGLAPHRVVLEITEGSLLDNAVAIERLRELRELGVSVAIDDFGTGYTSIGYLQRLPVQILKIDRSFVSGDALPSSERRAYLAAIIGLGHSLGLELVAEGIEDDTQLDEIRALGCQVGQGYLWSRPLPLGETIGLIDAIERRAAAR